MVRLRFLAIAAPGAGADPAPRALLQQARRRADDAAGRASPTAPRRRYLSKSATKRLPLTSKRARKGYYKGVGSRSTGRHTSKGKFIVDERKVVRLVVPDLEGFALKPYVAAGVPKMPYPLAAELRRRGGEGA